MFDHLFVTQEKNHTLKEQRLHEKIQYGKKSFGVYGNFLPFFVYALCGQVLPAFDEFPIIILFPKILVIDSNWSFLALQWTMLLFPQV